MSHNYLSSNDHCREYDCSLIHDSIFMKNVNQPNRFIAYVHFTFNLMNILTICIRCRCGCGDELKYRKFCKGVIVKLHCLKKISNKKREKKILYFSPYR